MLSFNMLCPLFNLFCKTFTIVYFTNCFIESITTVNYIVFADVFLKYMSTNQHIFYMLLKLIDVISNAQILYKCKVYPVVKQIKMNTNYILRKCKIIKEIPLYNISFYKENEILKSEVIYTKNDMNALLTRDAKINGYSENCMTVVEDYSNNMLDTDAIINVICYYDIPATINYKLSSIKFLYMSLTHDDIICNIDLVTEKFNFYIVGNIIDKLFILYYMKYHLRANCSDIHLDNFNYKLSFCDQNANFQTIDHTSYITIEENNYKIISTLEDKMEDEFVVT